MKPREMWKAVWPWLRRTLKVAGALVALAVVVVIGFIIFVHTDTGRNWVKGKVETALSDEVNGKVHIGKLSGSVFGHLTLHDVRIADDRGETVIEAAELQLRYAIWPLVHKRVEVSNVRLEGVRVAAEQNADGSINLVKLLVKKKKKKKEEPESKGGVGWVVEVAAVELVDSAAMFKRPGLSTQNLTAVSGRIDGIRLRGGDVTTDKVSLRATWQERGLTADVGGVVGLVDGVLSGRMETHVVADSEHPLARLSVNDLRLVTKTGRFAADLALYVRKQAAKYVPGEGVKRWQGDIELYARVGRADSALPIVVEGDGFVAGAPFGFGAELTPATERARTWLVLTGLDPQRAVAELPRGSVSTRVLADIRGFSKQALYGAVSVDADGVVKDYQLRRATVIGEASGGRLAFTGQLRSVQGRGDLDGALNYLADPVELERMHVNGYVGELRRVLPKADVRGSAWADANISGSVDNLDIKGTAWLRRVRQGNAYVASARARFHVTGSAKQPVITGTLTAPSVRYGKDRFEAVRISAHARDPKRKRIAVNASAGRRGSKNRVTGAATVSLGEQTRVDVHWLRGRIRGLTWRSTRGASIAVSKDGNVRVHGLRVASNVGSVKVDGTLKGGLTIIVKRVNIAELAEALELPPPYPRGVVDLRARVRQAGTRFLGTASGEVIGFALAPKRRALGGTFEANVGGRDTTLTAELSGEGIGKIVINGETRTPYQNSKPDAWKRMGARGVGTIRAQLTDLRVRGAEAFAGVKPVLTSGTVSGTVELSDGGHSVTGQVKVLKLGTSASTERVNGTFRVDGRAGRLEFVANADGRVLGTLDASAELHVPSLLLDAKRWQRLDEYAVVSATANAHKIDLRRVSASLPALPRMRGEVSGRLTVAEHAQESVLTINVRKLRNWRTRRRPVDVTTRATVGLRGTNVAVETRVAGKPVGNATATVAAGVRTVFEKGVDGLKTAPLHLRGDVRNLPVRLIADALALEQRRRMSGDMSGTLSVRGTVEKPLINGSADLASVRVDKVSFSAFDLRGSLGTKAVVVNATARQRSGGQLAASVTLQRTGEKSLQAAVTATRFQLAFLRGLERGDDPKIAGVAGTADSNLNVSGTLSDPVPRGSVTIRDGAIRIRKLSPLSGATVHATITPTRLTADMTARSGNGTVSGELTGFVERRKLSRATAEVRTEGFPYVTSNGYKLRIDSRTRLTARLQNKLWKVDAYVRRALVRLPSFQKARQLRQIASMDDVVFTDRRHRRRRHRRGRGRRGDKPPQPPKELSSTGPWMRIKIKAPDTIRLRSDVVQASATADLIVTLIEDDIVIEGVARATGGRLEVLDRRYDLRKAIVTFDGQIPANPLIDGEIAHEFKTMTLYVGISGRANDLDPPTFRSDPGGYDRASLLGFFLGRDPDSSSTNDAPLDDRAVNIASGLIASQVQQYVRAYLPIDELKIERDAATGTSKVTVGRWINDDLYFAYRYNPAAENTGNVNEYQLEYRLTKRWSLEATAGASEGGLDILWVKRY